MLPPLEILSRNQRQIQREDLFLESFWNKKWTKLGQIQSCKFLFNFSIKCRLINCRVMGWTYNNVFLIVFLKLSQTPCSIIMDPSLGNPALCVIVIVLNCTVIVIVLFCSDTGTVLVLVLYWYWYCTGTGTVLATVLNCNYNCTVLIRYCNCNGIVLKPQNMKLKNVFGVLKLNISSKCIN